MKPKARVKTPFILQIENSDCGAVALAIVLAFYRCYIPLKELREQCEVSRDGVSVAGLMKAAQLHHMLASQNNDIPSPETFDSPSILFWNHKHFVVLEGFHRNKIYINDPSKGRRIIDSATYKKGFSGVVIQLTPNKDFKRRPKESQWRSYLVRLLKNKWHSLSILFGTVCLLTLLNIATPIFSQQFIDHYATGVKSGVDGLFFAMMSFALTLQISVIFVQRKILRHLEKESTEEVGIVLIHKLAHLPAAFFARRKGGDLTQTLQALDRLAELFSGPLCTAFFGAVQMMIYLGLMLYYSPVLSVIACLISTIHLVFFHFAKKHSYQLSAMVKQELVHLNSLTLSIISMMLQIKLFGQYHCLTQWQKQLEQYLKAQQQLSCVHGITQSISFFLIGLAQVCILSMGGWQAMHHSISIGELIAFNVLFLSFNEIILQFVNVGNQLNLAQIDIQRTLDVMQSPTDKLHLNRPEPTISHGKIEIIDMTFGYARGEKPLFNNLNLTIEPHSKIAITGPSGSGKSTLANLIAGLYSPWSGAILIDGVPIQVIPPERRAALIGLISQEQFFFKGTVKENLCMWDEHYTQAQLLQVMKMACIEDMLINSDQGFDFQLTEGASNLSGGQKQRLEIARCMLKNPKIFIFDEATSALDSLIEDNIKQHVDQHHATSIWIAHRLSTIRNADNIFILKDGKLVDFGPHQTLVNQKSVHYQDLFGRNTPTERSAC